MQAFNMQTEFARLIGLFENELRDLTINVSDGNSLNPENIYKLRRRRNEMFEANLFGEPAWDIMLDLYLQDQAGKQVSITSACLAADVPQTTGLRWLQVLAAKGLVLRHGDPSDARRSHVTLSLEARQKMDALFT